MTRWLLIALPVGLLIIVLVKLSMAPDDLLSRLKENEKEVTDELKGIDKKINLYFKDTKSKRPEYLFLEEKISDELNELLEKRYYYEVRLSDIYEQLGDYYLDEQYLLKSAADNEYRRFYESLSIKDLTPSKLEMYWKNGEKEASRVFLNLAETRLIALGYFKKSAAIIFDKSSDLFKLKEDNSRNFYISPFTLLVSGDRLSHKLSQFKDGKSYLPDYIHKRVKPSLHKKMGQVFYQLTKMAFYLGIEKDDTKHKKIKKTLKDSVGTATFKIDENLKTPKYYSKLSEKEFLLSLMAEEYIRKKKESKIDEKIDKKFPGIHDSYDMVTTYKLAELYVYRYEKLNEYQKIFLLMKSKELLLKITNPKILDKNQLNDYRRNINKFKLKALMLLARIYYHYAYLTQDQMNTLKTSDINFGGNFNRQSDVKRYYLQKIIDLYDNRIIAYISESHKFYKQIHKTRARVKEELDALNR